MNGKSFTIMHRDFTFPVILIVIGVMFLFNEFVPRLEIGRTWPVILVAWGVLLLFRSFGPPRAPRGPQI